MEISCIKWVHKEHKQHVGRTTAAETLPTLSTRKIPTEFQAELRACSSELARSMEYVKECCWDGAGHRGPSVPI